MRFYFQGKTFYLTPTVEPCWKKLKLVVESHGGTVDTKRRKDVAQIKELNVRHDDPKYIIISCEHDLHLVTDVLLAKVGIFNAEFVMSSGMVTTKQLFEKLVTQISREDHY